MSQKLSDIIDSVRPDLNPFMSWMYDHRMETVVIIIVSTVITAITWSILSTTDAKPTRHVRWWVYLTVALASTAGAIGLFAAASSLPSNDKRAQQQALMLYSSQTYDIDLPTEVAQAIVTQQALTEVRDYDFLPTAEEADRLGVTILSYRVLSDGNLILLGDGDIIEPTN